LRERARVAGMSLNEAAIDTLAEGAGMAGARRKKRNLGDLGGKWKGDKALERGRACRTRSRG